MRLILARHGNTFGPEDTPVWVGRETDLPLVERGVAQARALARALEAAGLVPTAVFCGTLERTRHTAELVADSLGLPAPVADERLDEIDYGRWAGRTAAEVASELGQGEALRRWKEEDVWPEGAGWATSREELLAAVRGFLDELLADAPAESTPLVVSSNGVLRFIPRLLELEPPQGRRNFHVRTGHVSVLDGDGGAFRLKVWDAGPAELAP